MIIIRLNQFTLTSALSNQHWLYDQGFDFATFSVTELIKNVSSTVYDLNRMFSTDAYSAMQGLLLSLSICRIAVSLSHKIAGVSLIRADSYSILKCMA